MDNKYYVFYPRPVLLYIDNQLVMSWWLAYAVCQVCDHDIMMINDGDLKNDERMMVM